MTHGLNLHQIESAIGKLVLACSRVEYELFRLYQDRLPHRSYFSDQYAQRYRQAINVARRELGPAEGLVEMLVEMSRLAETRHIVAHNPVHYVNHEDRESLSLQAEFAIIDQKNGQQVLSISDLEGHAQSAYKLSVKLAAELRTRL